MEDNPRSGNGQTQQFTIKVSEKQPENYGSFCGWCISSSLPRQDDNSRWGNKKRYKKVIVRVVAEVGKKEMNNVKTLRPARINLGFVGWMTINLTGYIEKYKISRGITKKKYGSYLNGEAVSKTRLCLVFLRKSVRVNRISIVRAY